MNSPKNDPYLYMIFLSLSLLETGVSATVNFIVNPSLKAINDRLATKFVSRENLCRQLSARLAMTQTVQEPLDSVTNPSLMSVVVELFSYFVRKAVDYVAISIE